MSEIRLKVPDKAFVENESNEYQSIELDQEFLALKDEMKNRITLLIRDGIISKEAALEVMKMEIIQQIKQFKRLIRKQKVSIPAQFHTRVQEFLDASYNISKYLIENYGRQDLVSPQQSPVESPRGYSRPIYDESIFSAFQLDIEDHQMPVETRQNNCQTNDFKMEIFEQAQEQGNGNNQDQENGNDQNNSNSQKNNRNDQGITDSYPLFQNNNYESSPSFKHFNSNKNNNNQNGNPKFSMPNLSYSPGPLFQENSEPNINPFHSQQVPKNSFHENDEVESVNEMDQSKEENSVYNNSSKGNRRSQDGSETNKKNKRSEDYVPEIQSQDQVGEIVLKKNEFIIKVSGIDFVKVKKFDVRLMVNSNRVKTRFYRDCTEQLKTLGQDYSIKKPHRLYIFDWFCIFCYNVNQHFRMNCSFCGSEKNLETLIQIQ